MTTAITADETISVAHNNLAQLQASLAAADNQASRDLIHTNIRQCRAWLAERDPNWRR